MLRAEVPVHLGGKRWGAFVRRNAGSPYLTYLGPSVFGKDYVDSIRNASIGLGLLSKKFPELHTTRTLEIPACGTVLATESNAETNRIFRPEEAIFFQDYADLALQARELLRKPEKLADIARAGHQRVSGGAYSYQRLLADVLQHQNLNSSVTEHRSNTCDDLHNVQ